MAAMYTTIVVGTDGTESSHLAVRRAAGIAAAVGSELVLASAYFAGARDAAACQRVDSTPVVGDETAEQILASAIAVAREVGAEDVRAVMMEGNPVEALMKIVHKEDADLLVVGNRGINSLTGRLLGSVPADVARQSRCDVMIVHTVD
ncbi:universal stress protein [Corynebacterium heidelbergense]|uniref:Universal stress protein n=2 Tax=Corynebacterium heidelbergense TaxID=2055947 RepID=A0A364V4D0_9CORY|nr:universal stress protein [Corynebacterium heidelbergense]RAV31478.1 universal stress protein [Corynebacterium heidelbergense]